MKPFNLERALAGDQVVTRDNIEVHSLHVNIEKKNIMGYVRYSDILRYWNYKGKVCEYLENPDDLFMEEKPKKKLWIFVRKESDSDGDHVCSNYAYSDKNKEHLEKIDKRYYELIEIEV